MKGLGLIFQKKLKKMIFDNFYMFYGILNIGQIRISENHEKYRKYSVFEHVFRKIETFFSKIFFPTFFNSPKSSAFLGYFAPIFVPSRDT